MTRFHADPHRRAGGFTLIEVLVALAIVAVTLATGIKASAALGNNAVRMTDVTAGQWCASNQLTTLRLTRQFPGIGDSDFSCEQFGRVYSGKLRVRPTPNPNFRLVDAQMFNDAGEPVLTLSTLLGNPRLQL
jgi:general secretion pathway protein I